ncbi:uncharacterized protein LOC100750051 [Bombus impatiens]|uniref:Uncharacterized protein LOC100750051 n=1 Tax=Bombus impatiens TaxID=132113 RepID=A0A6P3V217_BOMIM|nr:uncharacterized protein LOC100750051 [Bombus impatiens]
MCHNKIILPKVVPVKYDDDYKLCLIFGWQSYVAPSSKVLAKPVLYYEVILNSWKMCTYMIKTNTTYTNVFCTMVEFKDEMRACAGNPGSPVICENQKHEIALVGIASWTNFSLECGDLPTYIDVGAFRAWMDDLVFNSKDTEEWENNTKLNEKQSTFKENINVHDSLWNHSDLLQLGSRISYWPGNTKIHLHNKTGTAIKYQEVPIESMNKSYFWNKLYPSISNNFNNKNASSSDGYYKMSYLDVAKEPSSNIYKYKEIGSSQKKNQFVGNFNGAMNKSLLCNIQQFDKVTVQQNKDQIEIDDFELLLPLNFEAVSYSNITVAYSKKLYLFFHFVFWYLYIIIYT